MTESKALQSIGSDAYRSVFGAKRHELCSLHDCDMQLCWHKEAVWMENPLQVGARKHRKLCFSVLCHVFKSVHHTADPTHSQLVDVHALQFRTTSPEGTATVAPSASKPVHDLEKVLF